MAKEKIFKPEDFDKKPPSSKKKKAWYKKPWIIGSIVLACAVAVGCVCVYVGKNESQTSTGLQLEVTHKSLVEDSTLQIDSLSPNPVDLVGETDEVKKEVIPVQPKLESNPISNSEIESEALKVIRGDYGNVPERRAKLGSRFQSVQNRVNKLKREGFF